MRGAPSPSPTSTVTSTPTATPAASATPAPTVPASVAPAAPASAPPPPVATAAPTPAPPNIVVVAKRSGGAGVGVIEYCVRYALAGVGAEVCTITVHPHWAPGSGPVVLGLKQDDAIAHYNRSTACWESATVGSALPDCWIR